MTGFLKSKKQITPLKRWPPHRVCRPILPVTATRLLLIFYQFPSRDVKCFFLYKKMYRQQHSPKTWSKPVLLNMGLAFSNHTAFLLRCSRAAYYFTDQMKAWGVVDCFWWPDLTQDVLGVCVNSRETESYRRQVQRTHSCTGLQLAPSVLPLPWHSSDCSSVQHAGVAKSWHVHVGMHPQESAWTGCTGFGFLQP